MDLKQIQLASDNWAPAHPDVVQSVAAANVGHEPAYGSDQWTAKAARLIQEALHEDCRVYFVPNGTGANVLALRLACRPHQSIICSSMAHIHTQETGAAEAIAGCKLLLVPHQKGKLTAEGSRKRLEEERALSIHSTSPKLLSITQPTEAGTVYTLEELKDLAAFCAEEKLLLHIDGSRLYNAAVHLNCSLREIIQAAKADLLSLGGTKNGLMGAEALVVLNSKLFEGSGHLHKQSLQLLSKMRYVSSQFIPLFQDELWRDLASNANQKALALQAILQELPDISFSYPVESNQVFFTAPPPWITKIQEEVACYPWGENELRFVTSWNTSNEEISGVEKIFQKLGSIPI